MKYVYVCICNEEDEEKSLGIKTVGTNVESGEPNDAGYVHTVEMIHSQYGCKFIATTLRENYSASQKGWRVMPYDAESVERYFSHEYDIQFVNCVGGGDSFGVGLIYALGTGMGCQDAIEFVTTASCLKQTIEGDFNRTLCI